MKYRPHTKPLNHQVAYHRLARDEEFFANLSEQGTGKTKSAIDEAGYNFEEKHRIDGLLVIAPNEGDIPANWLDQIAAHLPPRIARSTVRAKSQNMKARDRDVFQAITKGEKHFFGTEPRLKVITTNVEAIRSGSPIFKALLTWMRRERVMMVVDESTRIGEPGAAQTRAALKLGRNAVLRRLSTGTMTAGGPFKAFSQCLFLSETILGHDSYTAFKAEHCEMLPAENGLVRYIAGKKASGIRDPQKRDEFTRKMQSIIQLPKRTPDGALIYRNIDELHKKIAKYSFRVLKDDCLDLPPKIYMPLCYVDLTPKQKEIYEQVRTQVIAEFVHDREIRQMTVDMTIKRLLRLQQIVCNHYTPDPDVDEPKIPPQYIERWEDAPRIKSVLQVIQDAGPDARLIIWCRFHPEIAQIRTALIDQCSKWGEVVEYHGKMTKGCQVESRKRFLDRTTPVRYLVGQIKAGIGVDMYSAWGEYFYSNDWSLENRLQAEDRGHRIGLTNKLPIHDAYARGTVDDRLISTLRQHKEIHEMIMGDNPRNWI